jgi:flagellar biosynthetic protein FliO
MDLIATGTSAVGADTDLLRSLLAIAFVFGLLGLGAWALKRGSFGPLGRRQRSLVQIEATVPLGDRRSLMVVAVEGRRLLLGLTPAQVSLVTELITDSKESGEPGLRQFDAALDRARESTTTS